MTGQRPTISPDAFRRAGISLFGERPGWQSRLAETLGRDRASVSRWLAGSVPVPTEVALLVQYMLRYGRPEIALGDDMRL